MSIIVPTPKALANTTATNAHDGSNSHLGPEIPIKDKR